MHKDLDQVKELLQEIQAVNQILIHIHGFRILHKINKKITRMLERMTKWEN